MLQQERGALQSQLESVTAEKLGAEQREAWAHERARVAEQQRQILLRLSSGKQPTPNQALAEQQSKHGGLAEQQAQVQLGHDLGTYLGGGGARPSTRPSRAAAPCTPATVLVARPSPPPSLSPSPSWRGGGVHHEQ